MMAQARALQRNVKISARKAGLVCDLIRHRNVAAAIHILENTEKKAAPLLLKLLKAAIANAATNHAMNADELYIKSALANQGPTAKRTMPRAKGSADVVKKRTSHLEIIVSDTKGEKNAQKQAVKKVMKSGAKGIRTNVSGRLGGTDIAREEGYQEGVTPLATLRADIDYALAEAKTPYGQIGCKV
ncbi:unnamed protein product [Didymodactylos carnosus]|uniref:Large ribosomal subunit protein uL22c n=1 Tax=Didymodactylos carnosus TaxID=1234261 RepID=A0A8S2CMW3_9BILA|nr:unnamed protein product [Didymodactylos carnosus]CAF3532405.1 unnamed protein product [Didymodactylos carnosus]